MKPYTQSHIKTFYGNERYIKIKYIRGRFRNKLLSTPNCDNNYCRTCPIYDLSME